MRCGKHATARKSITGTEPCASGLGELTDRGRRTALDLGRRLRHLYVDQLRFLPEMLGDDATIYLRASPFSRALESLQQAFLGLYPSNARAAAFPGPTIYMRNPAEETLLPNEDYCLRFIQMSKAFARRTADRCKRNVTAFIGT